MISVLLPTRKRLDLLQKSVDSLAKNAVGEFEIMIRIDDDDEVSLSTPDNVLVTVIKAPRVGWGKNHEMYNELASMASGDWMMLWNDDFQMLTPRWDEIIERSINSTNGIVAIEFSKELNIAPVVSRKYYETIGHMAKDPHVDTWIQYVSRMAGCEVTLPISIKHLREEINDQTKKESQEHYKITSPHFYSDEVQSEIKKEVEIIKHAINN